VGIKYGNGRQCDEIGEPDALGPETVLADLHHNVLILLSTCFRCVVFARRARVLPGYAALEYEIARASVPAMSET